MRDAMRNGERCAIGGLDYYMCSCGKLQLVGEECSNHSIAHMHRRAREQAYEGVLRWALKEQANGMAEDRRYRMRDVHWPNERAISALVLRGSGLSFLSVGKALGVTRERARQLVKKCGPSLIPVPKTSRMKAKLAEFMGMKAKILDEVA